jgi:hypothetical protein
MTNPEYGPAGFDFSDIANMTVGLRLNAKDVCDIWMKSPMRRPEFGPREIHDIREAVYGLSTVLQEIENG